MELVAFIQVFNIIGIVIAIGALFYMCCRSLTFSSSSSSSAVDSAVADCAAVADDEDADIPPRREKYDVFISFRGEDTRLGFTSHLHAALLQKKIETYIDNRLQRGEEIGPALRAAVEKSTISVIIFSQNYASSAWCLDEVVHILKCKERYGQMVIPVFYDITPSHVRKQHGSYADAFAQLEKRFDNSITKVREWRDALTTAANLSGFDYSNKSGTEADLVQKVVDHIWIQLCRESSCDLNGFVGIESRIKQIELLLGIHSQDACITVGIWGMGGIGKTTLADAVFHKHSSKFEASCFLKSVRENSEQAGGLDGLEKTLLKEILSEEVLPIGSTLVRERLSRTRVLIVLDDVSSSMQMERLAGDRLRYGTGSRIIITTRDRSTLGQTVEEDYIYKVEILKPNDALQLFCSRAFKNNSTHRADSKESAENVVHYARGVPLALTVLGSLFFNCKSKEVWEDEFNKLKRFPSKSIQNVLRISYDRLERNEKDIFLDIACYFKGWDVINVKQMLHVRGFYATAGIRILIDMSLISIDSKWGRETIEMHDLLREMGRTIVQEQCFKDPCKWNRLFTNEDVYRVLKSNKETPNVEAIFLNGYNIAERPFKHADFKVMSNLSLLIVSFGSIFNASLALPDSLRYLEWWGYPLESLPSNFCPKNLVELHMPYSKVKELWKEEQILVNVQVIDLRSCSNLTEVPNLSGSLKIVEINLRHCQSLVEIPSYFQHLDKLTNLDLGYCRSIKYLPEMPGSIQSLDLQGTGIKELPESVSSNENIYYLNISDCRDLEKLPSNSCKLKASSSFNLYGCTLLGQTVEEDNIYEVEVLKPDDALQLCCSRASKNNSTRRTDYKESAEKVVHYARGVPLALTVLGSLFFNCKSKEDWEDEFNKLKRYPSESIQKVLRISYDRLEINEKEMFLDIACFFKGMHVIEVKGMLDVRGFFATTGIRILVDMSLISIDSKWERETIVVHDLLQKMGRTIVQEQCIKDPCKWSRLFTNEDVYRVLKSNMETPNVEAIFVNGYNIAKRLLKHADFKVMSNLSLLIVYDGSAFWASLDLPDSLRYLEWWGYPLESLPSNFSLGNLVELHIHWIHMPFSKFKELWKEEQILVNLQEFDLRNCSNLTEVPNLSRSLKIVVISLSGCESRVSLLRTYICKLKCLEKLNLPMCFEFTKVAVILDPMERLKFLNMLKDWISSDTIPKVLNQVMILNQIEVMIMGSEASEIEDAWDFLIQQS